MKKNPKYFTTNKPDRIWSENIIISIFLIRLFGTFKILINKSFFQLDRLRTQIQSENLEIKRKFTRDSKQPKTNNELG